jgi:hypothetical protein
MPGTFSLVTCCARAEPPQRENAATNVAEKKHERIRLSFQGKRNVINECVRVLLVTWLVRFTAREDASVLVSLAADVVVKDVAAWGTLLSDTF